MSLIFRERLWEMYGGVKEGKEAIFLTMQKIYNSSGREKCDMNVKAGYWIFGGCILILVIFTVMFIQRPSNDIRELSKSIPQPNSSSSLQRESPLSEKILPVMQNPFWNVPCKSNPQVQFTHDFTEVRKISSVQPSIITPGNSRHRAWLNIEGGQRVAVYAPVDSELVSGVYKSARGALDYDLHFQVSCEIWYLINHITEPVEKIKNVFPSTPQLDTRDPPRVNPPIQFKAGELLGYTTGTPLARNFDFGVFDLNHVNDQSPADGAFLYGKEKNFICPFDVLPKDLKLTYYSKIVSSERNATNCKESES